jgi:hypothetical protein
MKFSSNGGEILANFKIGVCCRFAAYALCIANVYAARASQTPDIQPQPSHVRAQTKSSRPPLKDPTIANTMDAKRTQRILYPSNAASKPPTVTLKNGILTVKADNSDLSQILTDVADVSGMVIIGSVKSTRVFGIYGPRNPRDVLTDLLTGSGYNFIMLGVTHEGAPRQLMLTLKNANSTDVTDPRRTVTAVDHSEDSDVNAPEQEHLGPGAIVHVPPAPAQDVEERTNQNLQRLQKMHDQVIQPQ